MHSSGDGPRLGIWAALSLVVSSMVGTGVFTSVGLQLVSLTQPATIVILWLLGGIIALCGAAAYAELGLTFPGSGGEFNFLSRIYHPVVGFLAGWLSAVVGFAAPIALSAMALGSYAARVVPGLAPRAVALGAILGIALLHATGGRRGVRVQQGLTGLILGIILLTILAGGIAPSRTPMTWQLSGELFSAPFAVALIYVEYAYAGWNAATYVAGEIAQPGRALPRALLGGTAVVCALYLLLNLTFLRSAPVEELRGTVEVAHVAATHVVGPIGARVMSAILVCVLLGSMSGMLFAGARIPATMAATYPALSVLGRRNAAGAPSRGVALQAAIALLMVLTGTFESVLTFVGFMLTLCTTLTVAGLFVVRARQRVAIPTPPAAGYRCWGYPVTPLLFLTVNLWMLVFVLKERPIAGLVGLLVLTAGIPAWWVIRQVRDPSAPPAA